MKTKQNKPKIKATNYSMKFESLEQMVNELITLHPEFDNIFRLDYHENVTPKELQDEVLEYFASNEPNVVEGINLPVSISVSANGVSLKTAKYFSIKWNFKYDRNGFITDIVATITTFIKNENAVPKYLSDMIYKLETGLWSVE